MKHLILTSLFLMGAATASAETVTEKVAVNKSWSASVLKDHSAWGTEACVASTLAADSKQPAVLEVYAEKVDTSFAEPTVQILVANIPEVFSAEVFTGALKRWTFTRASHPVDPTLQAVLARLDDREDIINTLKRDNAVTVKLKDVKGKLVKTLQFSLSGSSKTIDAGIKRCELKFEEL